MTAHFQGHVLEVGPKTFRASISDLSAPFPDEIVDFWKSAIRKSDQANLREGAIFSWSIDSGVSDIKFQTSPVFTHGDLVQAKIWATGIKESFAE